MQLKRTYRINSLDGLRALAIFGIVVYHLRLPWLPSGHLGVVVFLVLSGYLATASALRKLNASDGNTLAELWGLWWGRLRRLWPSVATLVAVTTCLCAALSPVLLTKLRPDVLPALGFFENWAYILRGASYFEQIGGTSPLLHLWYLGVDLQFFLAWTLVLAVLRKLGGVVVRRLALLLAVASAAWMASCYVPGSDPSRVYYGTDTRAFSLLLGSWLAFAFPLGEAPVVFRRLLVREVPARGQHVVGIPYRASILSHLLGLASAAGIGALMVLLPEDAPVYFWGGFAGVSLLCVVLIATLMAPGSLMARLLALPPLVALGKRAFALYLWHYPVFLLMAANKTTTPWYLRLAAVGVALVAAELSLRLIERPFSPVHAPRTPVRAGEQEDAEAKRRRTVRLSVTALAVAVAGAYAAWAIQTVPDESLVPEEALVSTGAAADQAMRLEKPAVSAPVTIGYTDASPGSVGQGEDGSADQAAASAVEVTDATVVLAPASETNAGIYDPVLIGDSVPGDAEWGYRLPHALIDTFIGRRPDQALGVFRDYVNQGVVGHVVVFACFSNTTPMAETLDEMVSAAGPDRQVFFVGTANPDGFQDSANAELQDSAARYDNVHYVDWPAVLDGHLSEYLWADETHLRPEGGEAYVDMVVRAVAQAMVNAGGSLTE